MYEEIKIYEEIFFSHIKSRNIKIYNIKEQLLINNWYFDHSMIEIDLTRREYKFKETIEKNL